MDLPDKRTDNLPVKYRITKENARSFWEKSILVRKAKRLEQELARANEQTPTVPELNRAILRQIAAIDLDMVKAKACDKLTLAKAKAELWKLVFGKPKAGRSSRPGSMPVARPIEDLATAPVFNAGMQPTQDTDKAQ